MIRVLLLLIGIGSAAGLAQGTPLKLGPLGVTVPAGWTTLANTAPVRIVSPESSPAGFLSAEFFQPEQTTQDVRQHLPKFG